MYAKILALLTLEDESARVLRKARDLAAKLDSELTAVHVVEYVPLAGTEDAMLTAPIDLAPELESRAEERMRELAQSLDLDPACCRVVVGDLLSEVQDAVAQKQVDLVIVGNHCRRGFAALFEHAQEAVLRRCGCDLLAVNLDHKDD